MKFSSGVVKIDSSRARRLLVLHPSDEGYGSDRVMLALIRAAMSWGYEVRVLLPNDAPDGWLSGQLAEMEAVSVVRGAMFVARRRYFRTRGMAGLVVEFVKASRFVRSEVVRFGPSVVHVNTCALPIGVLARGGWRLVWHVHEIPRRRLDVASVLGAIAARSCDVCVAVSEAAGSKLRSVTGRPDRIVVIRNGLPDGDEPKPWADRQYDIAFVGRVNAWKGYEVYIEAVRKLVRGGKTIGDRVVLAGGVVEGSDSAARLRSIASAEAEGVLKYLGEVADGNAVIRDTRVLVVPSTAPDPLPTTVIEGLRAGCAVVGSNIGGIPELLPPRAGVLVAPGDADAVRRASEALLVDSAAAERLGKDARRHFLSELSQESFLSKWKVIYAP